MSVEKEIKQCKETIKYLKQSKKVISNHNNLTLAYFSSVKASSVGSKLLMEIKTKFLVGNEKDLAFQKAKIMATILLTIHNSAKPYGSLVQMFYQSLQTIKKNCDTSKVFHSKITKDLEMSLDHCIYDFKQNLKELNDKR